MEPSNVVEYIDRQKIMCAVILEVKNERLRLLTENNREIKLSASRLSHSCGQRVDLAMGRDHVVQALKEIGSRRRSLMRRVNIRELWEILNSEEEWIDLETMAAFCFNSDTTGDHESAVIRAFFENRIYFKFSHDRFYPNSEDQVARLQAQAAEAGRRSRLIDQGGGWLRQALASGTGREALEDPVVAETLGILQSYTLFGKDSDQYELAKAIVQRAGANLEKSLFPLFVQLGIWEENENLDLLRLDVPLEFSAECLRWSERLRSAPPPFTGAPVRRDLTHLPLLTIDGQATLDYDDALSLEDLGDRYRLGIHIADVGHYVKRDDPIDREAAARGSSIYTADRKIPMIPPDLAEGLCSLRAGELRPAISVMATLSRSGDLLDYEIFASTVAVSRQLSYYEANLMVDADPAIGTLVFLAEAFRRKRLENGALQITLPEINIWLDESGEITLSRINRESPSRMMVAELMIMGNWLMADFLRRHKCPAVFRAQAEPRERLYRQNEGTLFQNWMQRKQISRFMLGCEPESHSGLGLDAYVTATSPIRKYFDMITQRQLRALLGLDSAYDRDQVATILAHLETPMRTVSRVQYQRQRYWTLKYLEKKIGQKTEAIVLQKRRNGYLALITEYMLECQLPLSIGIDLKPEDLVQVTIQYVNARSDMLSVFIG
jgi:exoribonuclease-2